MRSLTQTGATTLMGVLLAGCGAESGPTAVNVAAHAADAATRNTGNHIKVVEPFTEPLVNPVQWRSDCLLGGGCRSRNPGG